MRRLALGALSTVYRTAGDYTGPVPRSVRKDHAGEVTIVFGGIAADDTLEVRHKSFGFEVFDTAAAAWTNASVASAHGGSVTLSGNWKAGSHVRYLWQADPCPLLECPLYSRGTYYKLPASPFWAPLA